MRSDEGGLVVRLLIGWVVFELGEIWIFVRLEVEEIELFLSQGQRLDMVRSSSRKFNCPKGA